MIGRISHILIATFIGFRTFALSDHWGVPRPEDLPTKFTLKAAWNPRLGTELKKDCEALIDGWPRSGPLETLYRPQIMYVGACAIGLYVQNPRRSGINNVREQWEKIFWTTSVAIDLHVGTARAGWSIDFTSGLQVCFFFNIHQSGRFDLYRDMEWNLDQSPFFQGRTDAPIFPDRIPLIEPEQWFMDLRNRMIGEGYPPALAATAQKFSAIGAGAWGTRPVSADCANAISHLGIESWFIARTGVTLEAPLLETDGHCTLGIYLMHPLDTANKDVHPYARVRGLGIDIVHEATELLRKVESQRMGGGYIDLHNGLELCLYDQSSIDPSNVCAKMTKMRLRDCLDNRAEVNERRTAIASASRTATTKARRTATSVATTVATTIATTTATAISPRVLRGH
ncbi:hypothetical protein MMC17_009923 [Xylographa soralifera]|nr:hypothetical protein [Xylographa soralifera]